MVLLLSWTLILLSDKEHYSRGVAGRRLNRHPNHSGAGGPVQWHRRLRRASDMSEVSGAPLHELLSSTCAGGVLMSKFTSFLFLAGINLLGSIIGCAEASSKEREWGAKRRHSVRARSHIVIFPPAKMRNHCSCCWMFTARGGGEGREWKI